MIITTETDKFITHVSDSGYKIKQIETGIVYDSATDIKPCRYTYEETDELIFVPEEENTDEISASEALRIIMGDE